MIFGVGTDICAVERIARVLNSSGDKFLKRVFREGELSEKNATDANHIARRYAAKEAVAKALGVGIGEKLSFQDIYIEREGNMCPKVKVFNSNFLGVTIHLSISDEKDYAVAFAVAEKSISR